MLSLCKSDAVGDEGLRIIADACPLLATLDLSFCSEFTVDGLSAALRTMFMRPSNGCTEPLRNLCLSSMRFSANSAYDSLLENVLFAQAENPNGPVLERLIAEDWYQLSPMPLRKVWEASSDSKVPMLSALTELRLPIGWEGWPDAFELEIEKLQFCTPNLEVLDLNGRDVGCSLSMDEDVEDLHGPCWPRLKACKVARYGEYWDVTAVPPSYDSSRRQYYYLDIDVHRLIGSSGASLEELDLRDRDEGAGTIAEILATAPKLIKLVLSYNQELTADSFASLLASVKCHSALEVLHANAGSNAFVSDKALAMVAHVFPSLKELAIRGGAITSAGLQEFEKQLENAGRLQGFKIETREWSGEW